MHLEVMTEDYTHRLGFSSSTIPSTLSFVSRLHMFMSVMNMEDSKKSRLGSHSSVCLRCINCDHKHGQKSRSISWALIIAIHVFFSFSTIIALLHIPSITNKLRTPAYSPQQEISRLSLCQSLQTFPNLLLTKDSTCPSRSYLRNHPP